jgi:hypothetical protein
MATTIKWTTKIEEQEKVFQSTIKRYGRKATEIIGNYRT